MPHTRSTCPVPNCRICLRLAFIAENKFIRKTLDLPPAKPKVMKSAPIPRPISKLEPPTPVHYRACKEVGSCPGWRAEPVDYVGRGVVYLFDTEPEAIEKANEKNKEAARRAK